ncbi:hypothetical protein EZV62_009376 [Acer yangbiense]|uniref:HMA domain-containing protein n=1 Tax=Acer yangbiense TaxID=1000413 RepID=A0A5C7IG43_9ROSI|nr:hypothetical protein EZV62_009376 [Acer yangbiense]
MVNIFVQKKIVFKVKGECKKCWTKAMKIVAVAEGEIFSVAWEGECKEKMVVIGDGVDVDTLTRKLRKKLCYAELLLVEEVKVVKTVDKKEVIKVAIKETIKEEKKKHHQQPNNMPTPTHKPATYNSTTTTQQKKTKAKPNKSNHATPRKHTKQQAKSKAKPPKNQNSDLLKIPNEIKTHLTSPSSSQRVRERIRSSRVEDEAGIRQRVDEVTSIRN